MITKILFSGFLMNNTYSLADPFCTYYYFDTSMLSSMMLSRRRRMQQRKAFCLSNPNKSRSAFCAPPTRLASIISLGPTNVPYNNLCQVKKKYKYRIKNRNILIQWILIRRNTRIMNKDWK